MKREKKKNIFQLILYKKSNDQVLFHFKANEPPKLVLLLKDSWETVMTRLRLFSVHAVEISVYKRKRKYIQQIINVSSSIPPSIPLLTQCLIQLRHKNKLRTVFSVVKQKKVRQCHVIEIVIFNFNTCSTKSQVFF